jgi:hypothetical protein
MSAAGETLKRIQEGMEQPQKRSKKRADKPFLFLSFMGLRFFMFAEKRRRP